MVMVVLMLIVMVIVTYGDVDWRLLERHLSSRVCFATSSTVASASMKRGSQQMPAHACCKKNSTRSPWCEWEQPQDPNFTYVCNIGNHSTHKRQDSRGKRFGVKAG